ncbi:MAG: hypothetical protein M3280_05125 [Actinomycetota bacterium]|nr:hypothetical protein [Actinomycetota bacterium]
MLLVVVDSLFGAGVGIGVWSETLSETTLVIAIIVLGIVLVASLVAITLIEMAASKQPTVKLSGLTASTGILNQLINGTLETVCRATSLPQTPESAKLRVFIFRIEERDQLVCRYYWSPNPTKEAVGVTRFALSPELMEEIAVVRCAMTGKITRMRVEPLSGTAVDGTKGPVSEDVRFVLAAPILDADDRIWGTVDFDTSNTTGETLLSTEISEAAMFQLAQHLKVIFAIQKSSLSSADLR